MPRKVRVEYPRAIYHVMNRGDRRESGEEKARRILAEELKRLRWTAEELIRQRIGDPRKVRIAKRLRSETTMTLKWIAREWHMGA